MINMEDEVSSTPHHRWQIEATVVLVGDRDVEKAKLCHLYSTGVAPDDDLGFGTKEMSLKHDSADVTFTLSEISGQEDFASVRHLTYKRADAFLLCFASKNKQSFANTKTWMDDIKEVCPSKPTFLVDIGFDKKRSTKSDYVRTKDAKKHAKQLGCVQLFQCSLESKDSVFRLFKAVHEYIISEKIKSLQNQESNNASELSALQKEIAALDLQKVADVPPAKIASPPSSLSSSGRGFMRLLSPRSSDKKKKETTSPRSEDAKTNEKSSPVNKSKKEEPERRERADSLAQSAPLLPLRNRSATVSSSPSNLPAAKSGRASKITKNHDEIEKIHNKMVKLGEKMLGFYVELQLELSDKFPLPTKDDISGWLCLTLQKYIEERVACFSVNTFILKILDQEEWKHISEVENVYGTKIKLLTITGFVGKNHCDSYFPPIFPIPDD